MTNTSRERAPFQEKYKRTFYRGADNVLASLDPDSVVSLLPKRLNWAVQVFENRAVATGDVAGLRGFVVGRREGGGMMMRFRGMGLMGSVGRRRGGRWGVRGRGGESG